MWYLPIPELYLGFLSIRSSCEWGLLAMHIGVPLQKYMLTNAWNQLFPNHLTVDVQAFLLQLAKQGFGHSENHSPTGHEPSDLLKEDSIEGTLIVGPTQLAQS